MNKEELEKILLENKDEIIGVSINHYFYNVDYINYDNIEFDNEPVLNCYELDYYDYNDNKHVSETQFTMNDLLNTKQLEFYKHVKI